MAFSWFAEHKLPCNWFASLLANAMTPVGCDCLLLSVGRDATICKTGDWISFHNTITMNKHGIDIHPGMS